MKDTRFAQLAIFINSAVPLALLSWDWYHHRLGANPTEFATRTTGVLTLLFVILSLAVTPLRKLLGLPWMIKFRRLLGLY
jgi:sulfoxide reductase heme-binding subunit YedZ